jgi:hypothetical protein
MGNAPAGGAGMAGRLLTKGKHDGRQVQALWEGPYREVQVSEDRGVQLERLRLEDGDVVLVHMTDPDALFDPTGLTEKQVAWVFLGPGQDLRVLTPADLAACGLQRVPGGQ